jgi:hypothetical protein
MPECVFARLLKLSTSVSFGLHLLRCGGCTVVVVVVVVVVANSVVVDGCVFGLC